MSCCHEKTNTAPEVLPPNRWNERNGICFFLKLTCPGSQTGWKDDLPFPKAGKGSLGILDGNPDPLGTSGVLPSTVWMDLAICLRGMTGTSGVSQHVVPLSFKSCAS